MCRFERQRNKIVYEKYSYEYVFSTVAAVQAGTVNPLAAKTHVTEKLAAANWINKYIFQTN